MFDLFSPSHLLIIAVAVLVFVGPKDVPRLFRMIGKWTGKARGMMHELRSGLDDMQRGAELNELRDQLNAMQAERRAARTYAGDVPAMSGADDGSASEELVNAANVSS